ncbi:MAG: ABC transporter permease [Oligoflexia bacterium]|nr:ABC transporter permease [Oligoflexia bacterium]
MRKMKLSARLSLAFLMLISLMAISAPLITRHSYDEQNIQRRLEAPSHDYWMGTDLLGRDLYSRMLYGARTSLTVGICTTLAALLLGLLGGATAGYFGGRIDRALMRVVDLFYLFPSLLLAILLMIFLGRGLSGILISISLTAWVVQARLVRGQVLQARELAYVESARALGLGNARIIFRHVVPNLWGPIIVSLTLQIPTNIMAESFLSFLGLGIRPPLSSWGTLAADGLRAIRYAPHLIIFPGGILFLTALAFNTLGDWLAGWLDPARARILPSRQ